MGYQRPNPDELLARVKEEEAKNRRGKLKIFFGAAAGVGKTYAMLEAAQLRKSEGVDVVALARGPHVVEDGADARVGFGIGGRSHGGHRASVATSDHVEQYGPGSVRELTFDARRCRHRVMAYAASTTAPMMTSHSST